ncbi:MAG: TonB family protein [Candidatus Binatus sp.]|uniref:energy transducer TonB n=1 Tax=Candidatus Binatus sp. TaxID=2811406 RepID=UPI002724AF4A|nr:TonB family protein [Candidatus Binatus sp.]MDO8433632.1 TonB family protein [Candidatus Binatus sp.]
MTPHAEIQRIAPLDDPWRRMVWLLPAAIIAWAVLLFAFARLLQQSAPPPPELKPIEARIVEMPIGGLQGGGGGAPSTPAVKPRPKPIAKPAPRPRVMQAPRKALTPPASIEGSPREKAKQAPVESPSSGGTADENGSAGSPTTGESSNGASSEGASGEGTGGGTGPGSDSTGARAIYAPAPVIPDELREDVIQAEAVAHFRVSPEGDVEVSLATPTPNPRLNQLLLETLRQWQFFPATRSGIAIEAAFDVRIPITVQ